MAVEQPQESSVVPARQVMDEADAADYLRQPSRTLEYWRSKGSGPPYIKDPQSRKVWYLKHDLDGWLESMRVTPGDEDGIQAK